MPIFSVKVEENHAQFVQKWAKALPSGASRVADPVTVSNSDPPSFFSNQIRSEFVSWYVFFIYCESDLFFLFGSNFLLRVVFPFLLWRIGSDFSHWSDPGFKGSVPTFFVIWVLIRLYWFYDVDKRLYDIKFPV